MMMRFICILFLSFFLGNQAFSKCRVHIGDLNWDSSNIHTAVVGYLLKHGYDCEVKKTYGATLPIYSAWYAGNVDLIMEIWYANLKAPVDKALATKKVQFAGEATRDPLQAWFIPKYLQEQYPDLQSVEDLKRYRHLFQSPLDKEKGRFYNCVAGWGCTIINTIKLQAYGLNEYYEDFIPGSGGALSAAFKSAYTQKQPIVGYYWGPTLLMSEIELVALKEPEYKKNIWSKMLEDNFELVKKNGGAGIKNKKIQATEYPPIPLYIGVTTKWAKENPRLMAFLGKYHIDSETLSKYSNYLRYEEGGDLEKTAIRFLKGNTQWQGWLPAAEADKVKKSLNLLGGLDTGKDSLWWDKNPINIDFVEPTNQFIDELLKRYGHILNAFSKNMTHAIILVGKFLSWLPWSVFLLSLFLISYLFSRSWRMTSMVTLSTFLLASLGENLWLEAMQTLSLMLISVLISLVIGIPLGIISAKSKRISSYLKPALDFMQTMPSFVYLVPAIMLFGLGEVPAVFATLVYAIPPLIRLTELGIREIDKEIIEVTEAFGDSFFHKLFFVEIPLALPSIMQGINQMTMMALSMVVIASMIGAPGLGKTVLVGMQQLNVGLALQAGVAIVLLAIILDRIIQAIGQRFGGESE